MPRGETAQSNALNHLRESGTRTRPIESYSVFRIRSHRFWRPWPQQIGRLRTTPTTSSRNPAKPIGTPLARHFGEVLASRSMGTNNRIPEQQERARRAEEERQKTLNAIQRIERWNEALADPLPRPTFADALRTGRHWLHVYCSGCNTSTAVDLRQIDRHPRASVESVAPSLRCTWCHDRAPIPRLLGLFCEPTSSQSHDRAG